MNKIEMDPRLGVFLTNKEKDLLIDMWTAKARKTEQQALVEQMPNNMNHRTLEWEKEHLKKLKDDLAVKRKSALGTLYYSKRNVWKYLTSMFYSIDELEEDMEGIANQIESRSRAIKKKVSEIVDNIKEGEQFSPFFTN